jgi:hypothetical protein
MLNKMDFKDLDVVTFQSLESIQILHMLILKKYFTPLSIFIEKIHFPVLSLRAI